MKVLWRSFSQCFLSLNVSVLFSTFFCGSSSVVLLWFSFYSPLFSSRELFRGPHRVTRPSHDPHSRVRFRSLVFTLNYKWLAWYVLYTQLRRWLTKVLKWNWIKKSDVMLFMLFCLFFSNLSHSFTSCSHLTNKSHICQTPTNIF